MNFESLKEDWNSKQEHNVPFSERDLKLKESHSFIDKVRKNMRLEFYLSIIIALLITVVIPLGNMSPVISPVITSVCTITFTLIFVVTLFYFKRFYSFYKTSTSMSFNTHDSLLWFYYEMKLNIEVYRSYAIIVFFLGLLAISISTLNAVEPFHLFGPIKLTAPRSLIILISILLFFVVIYIVSIEYWIRISYGKYVKRIKAILDELKGE